MATIEKRGDAYRIRVSVGYDVNGKQLTKSITWRPAPGATERQIHKELKRQETLFEERVRSGQYIDAGVRFADFAEQWLENYGKEHLKATTYKNYSDCMKRIIPAIGHIRLDRLQPHHLISFYNNLAEDGIRGDTKYKPLQDIKALHNERHITQVHFVELSGLSIGTVKALRSGKNVTEKTARTACEALNIPLSSLFTPCETAKQQLSGATASYYHHVISSILTSAVQWQIIAGNPAARVKPPRAERKEIRYLNNEQALTLLECLNDEPLVYKAFFTVLLFSGMRRGEACGLEWKDIDFERGIIDTNKESLYVSGKGVYDDDTKTRSSRRVIPMLPQVAELLKKHKAFQAMEQLKAGDQWEYSGKVFTVWNGKQIHPDTVSGWFRGFIKRHDLPPVTVHGLRHTNASLLITGGTDAKTVSALLGHSQVSTTLNIYTHTFATAQAKAMEALSIALTQDNDKQKKA